MNDYLKYENVTKEILDEIKVGDLVKVNDWKKPLRVKAVSDNYFVMCTKAFGKCIYSVCEKKKWEGIKHNSMVGGMFHVGTDSWLFGSPVFLDGYDFDNVELTQKYLNSFELPQGHEKRSELSHRTAIPINELYVKHATHSRKVVAN